MNRAKDRRILLGLALAFLVLLLVDLLLLASAQRQRQTAAWTQQTRDVLEKMNELVTYLSEAENGRRGFVLSGQERYYGHHTNRLGWVHRTLSDLRQLVARDPRYVTAEAQLQSNVFERLTIFTNSIQARRLNGLDTAAQIGFIEQGQIAMEPIRQLVTRLTRDERAQFTLRQAEQDQNTQTTVAFSLIVSLFGLGLFATLLALFVRANRQRRAAEAALQETNQQLEQRVKDRTAALETSHQQLETEISVRRETERALSVSHERTRAVFDAALDGVITMNQEGKVTEFNPAAEQIFGRRRRDVIGQPLSIIIPEHLREQHARGLSRYLATGKATVLGRRIEIEGLRADGSIIAIELSIARMPGDGPPMFAGFVRDITDRKRAEDQVRESEARFRQIAESLPQLIWTCAPEGPCDFLSRRWVEFTGRPLAEQLGSGWLQQIHPEDQARLMVAWQAAVTTGSAYREEFRIRRHDGVFRWFDTRAEPLKDTAGQIVKWFGSNTDITDQKEAEERLRTQLARLALLSRTTRAINERQDLTSIFQVVVRSLEEHLPVEFACVCLYEPGQEYLTVSSVGAQSQALGQTLELLAGRRLPVDQNGLARCVHGQLVYEPDLSVLPFPFPQRLARSGLRSLVIAPLLIEGTVFAVLIAARRPEQGFSSADCEFLRQLSEHVALAAHQAQLHGALQEAYDELRQTQQAAMQQERLRALGQMASGIAHDINNAISPVALYTESLLQKEPDLSPRARSYLEVIARAIDDVAATVARLREFYRQREPQLNLTPVRLQQVAEQVIELTRARWNAMPLERGIVITLQSEFNDAVPDIHGVESEIREALTNLIFNAVDAMPAGGIITVRTTKTEGPPAARNPQSLIEITDTGIGMDEETRRRCLEPFFTTKGERGTGLGLAMVYGMVRRHGGEIEILSQPGHGTTVRIAFPVPTVPLPPRPEPAPRAPIPSGLRILVVDDDPLLLKSLADILAGDGHAIFTAQSGQAGIEAFESAKQRQEEFDVVITDLGMPRTDGREVSTAIKAISPATPVILLTGWGQRLVGEPALPADRVLNKPPKLQELRETLASLYPSPGI
jgi:PAS domain S-box-containing protein